MLNLISGRVMIFGTFDILHLGHRKFIEAAKKRGRELIIVVARDSTVKRLKPSLAHSESERKRVIHEAFPDTTVVLGDRNDPMKVVQRFRPGLVCLGYDQIGFSEQLRKDFPEIPIERLKAYRPRVYKSSLLKDLK